jgi:hypothetical protein
MTLTVGGSWYADLDLLVRQPLTMWTQLCPNTLVVRSDVTRAPLAVGAISYVQHTLGLSLKQTLRAAHISPRTYHSWKENLDRHPRIRSQGRLWQLHQLTEDLTETLGELGAQQWLAEDDSRLTRMMRGHFDNLVAEVYGSSVSAQDAVQNFDAALDERESKLHLQRRPLTRVKANPGDVAGPDT